MLRMIIAAVAVVMYLTTCIEVAFSADNVPVFVSVTPQKYFVRQIGKDHVDIEVMVKPGASPATYEPKPRQMARLAKTKIYFAIGVPFEKVWIRKIAAANPEMKVIHTDQGIKKIAMQSSRHQEGEGGADEHEAHADKHYDEDEKQEAEEHDQESGGLDPHIWLSPPLVKIQAGAILRALREADPSHRAEYEENHKRFVSAIDQLDAELKSAFAGKAGMKFMVFHPSWGYFAEAYGLVQVPIEIEGKEPKPAQLKELIEHARENGVIAVFAQPQFSTRSAKLIAREIEGKVVFADPLAEDWQANLRQAADKFNQALK